VNATSGAALDTELRAMVADGAFDRATEGAIRAYGGELIRWLCSILPSEADAHDAFSWLSEELWRSLRRYEGGCSIRAWCYMLANQGASRVRARPQHRHEELVSSVSSIAADVWSTTARERDRKDAIYVELRNSLDAEDQMLLVLRVDRDLSWREIAIVMLGDAVPDEEVVRKAAALRKQFERVKHHLRGLAEKRLAE
jgi:RNA polymerase sigma-70 factor (ECF subfamily)